MSHRKVRSQGSIPFSWEDKPGVCKTPLGIGSLQGTINQIKSSSEVKIPLPPCPSQPPSRSTSGKGLRWQQDPFLVAYKECTKNERNGKKKGVGSGSTVGKTKSIFSCKTSSDVRDGNFLKLSRLPRLPTHRNGSLTLQLELKRDFKYEPWL